MAGKPTMTQLRGCFLGAAAGDALGYMVDRKSMEEILTEYGPEGICYYDVDNGYALISYHTQLAMFTANGLLFGATRGKLRGVMAPYVRYVQAALRDWTLTQRYGGAPARVRTYSWLYHVEPLHARRDPEPLLLDALGRTNPGTMEEPPNHSRACGALSRAAAIGSFFDPNRAPRREADRLAAEAAALTHGDPAAFLSAAAFAHIVSSLIYCTPDSMDSAVAEAIRALPLEFGRLYPQVDGVCAALAQARQLAGRSEISPAEAQAVLQGEDAPGALAAGVYAALKYPDDLEQALPAAVNHGGRSAACGFVTGALLGARLGVAGIPRPWTEPLELAGILEELADDIFQGCPMSSGSLLFDDLWDQKYVQCEY